MPKKYKCTLYVTKIYEYVKEVEADNEDDASDIVEESFVYGNVDLFKSNYEEIDEIEVEEIE